MKQLDELKESVDSLDKVLQRPHPGSEQAERALLSDCLNGIVKVLVALTTPPKPDA